MDDPVNVDMEPEEALRTLLGEERRDNEAENEAQNEADE